MQLGRGTIAVAALLVSVAVSYARAQSCAPLSSSAIQGVPRTDVCSSSVLVLPYSSVYVPAGASIDTLDTAFSATQIQLFLTVRFLAYFAPHPTPFLFLFFFFFLVTV